MLLLGWLWRILIWGLFLFRVSRLDLQLVPTHPDLVGGLQFVGESLRAFLPVSFTISAIDIQNLIALIVVTLLPFLPALLLWQRTAV